MGRVSIRTEIPDKKQTVVYLSGLFEGEDASQSEEQLMQVLISVKTPQLVIDVSEIHYMDSSAIGTLINLGRAAEKQKTKIFVRNPNKYVKKILGVTRADSLLPIIED